MDYSQRLSISYYKTIATLNEEHHIFLVQHMQTKKIYVKKVIDIYNKNIYQKLMQDPIPGTAGIVELYEEGNSLTVIEEYISGDSLEDLLSMGKVTPDKICLYISELCNVVEMLHSCNPPIIHRDIKPSNIIITRYDHVVLLDFNAAKYFERQNDSDTVLLGTKGYAAPEQYGFGSSTIRTDIYAIGIVLETLCSFDTNNSSKWDAIIKKCTQINPEDRFQTISELKKAIYRVESPSRKSTQSSKKKLHLDRSYLPPGYRTGTPWKMILATLVYILIFELSFSIVVEGKDGLLIAEKLSCLYLFIAPILCIFNYRNIHKIMPLCSSNNRLLRVVGVFFLIVIALLFLCLFIVASA